MSLTLEVTVLREEFNMAASTVTSTATYGSVPREPSGFAARGTYQLTGQHTTTYTVAAKAATPRDGR